MTVPLQPKSSGFSGWFANLWGSITSWLGKKVEVINKFFASFTVKKADKARQERFTGQQTNRPQVKFTAKQVSNEGNGSVAQPDRAARHKVGELQQPGVDLGSANSAAGQKRLDPHEVKKVVGSAQNAVFPQQIGFPRLDLDPLIQNLGFFEVDKIEDLDKQARHLLSSDYHAGAVEERVCIGKIKGNSQDYVLYHRVDKTLYRDEIKEPLDFQKIVSERIKAHKQNNKIKKNLEKQVPNTQIPTYRTKKDFDDWSKQHLKEGEVLVAHIEAPPMVIMRHRVKGNWIVDSKYMFTGS